MTAKPTRSEATDDPAVADLAKALSACVVWMEQFGCEVMLLEEQCLMDNARRALARAGYEVTLEDFLEVQIAAGRLRGEIDDQTGEVVYARGEGAP